jgi:hypothetical protein
MKKISLGIVLLLPFIFWAIVCIYKSITFDINCGDRIKRAADANTIELATKEMEAVVNYIEVEGMINGYTSIIYRTPNEDVTFWYNNLKSSLEELKKVNPEASQLEKSNLLMKLRETLLDHGSDGVKVTAPSGISKYPSNTAYAVWLWIGIILLISGVILIAFGKEEL